MSWLLFLFRFQLIFPFSEKENQFKWKRKKRKTFIKLLAFSHKRFFCEIPKFYQQKDYPWKIFTEKRDFLFLFYFFFFLSISKEARRVIIFRWLISIMRVEKGDGPCKTYNSHFHLDLLTSLHFLFEDLTFLNLRPPFATVSAIYIRLKS